MVRPRKKDTHLPPCAHHRHGAYYLVKGGKWERLSSDLASALPEYGKRFESPTGGMAALIDEAFPIITRKVCAGTREQYRSATATLKYTLADFSPDQVKHRDVVRVRRELAAMPNTANRCVSVLRMVFDYALHEELVDANPWTGVKRLEENKGERYVTDGEFLAIRAKASPLLIMDLCYGRASESAMCSGSDPIS